MSRLDVEPLTAHLFIFYYGMMSMVTPPVTSAAYASASIADALIMKAALSSFQYSLAGFTCRLCLFTATPCRRWARWAKRFTGRRRLKEETDLSASQSGPATFF